MPRAFSYTTLERLPLLDYRINQFTKKPVAKLDAPVRAVLRAGLAQARYMNVPLPAAVNESVKLTRALGKPVPQAWSTPCCAAPLPPMFPRPILPTPGPALDLLLPVPPGGRSFYAQFGEEAFPLAAAFYEKPKTTIRVNTLRTNDTALTALLQRRAIP